MPTPFLTAYRLISSRSVSFAFAFAFLLPLGVAWLWTPLSGKAAQGGTPVVVVSAASYAKVVAPDSIAAAFGARLATSAASATNIPLPNTLAGTTVRVNGVLSQLLYVSPSQINFIIPKETAPGTGAITVTAGDGAISTGSFEVKAVAPGIFIFGGGGQGVPAGYLLRGKIDGSRSEEQIFDYNASTGIFTPKPISLGPPGERLFLVLFLTGVRGAEDANKDGNVNETMHVLLGGNEIAPDYIGPQGYYVGLDQVNVEIPRSMIGRGPINLAINHSTLAVSNIGHAHIGGAPPPTMSVSSYSATTTLAGQELLVNGTGFAINPTDNKVFILDGLQGAAAKVMSATANQLRIVVPYGAGSGTVMVRTAQGEAAGANRLTLRTSISGVVETTKREPMQNVNVSVIGTSITAKTNAEGRYLLPDVPDGNREIKIDPSGLPLPFPSIAYKVAVVAERDNQIENKALQQQNGPSLTFGAPASSAFSSPDTSLVASPSSRVIQTGGVTFEVADNATAVFPNGATSGSLFLSIVENSRVPAKLPAGIFSSSVVMLTPIGTKLTPGGKLTFPNPDNIAANTQAKLYKLDQTSGSPTLGQFVEAGNAAVSADGQRIETGATAITEASYYFVAVKRPVTNVIGRVLDSDGTTPVQKALVVARGQEVYTDGTGRFALQNVVINNASDLLTVEAIYLRPEGRVDRTQRSGVAPAVNGVTVAPDLVLPSVASNPNRPPTVLAPQTLSATEGAVLDARFIASDPDPGQMPMVTATGVPFASVLPAPGSEGVGVYRLVLTPGVGVAGNYTVTVKATDNLGASSMQNIALTVSPMPNRAPVLTVPAAQTAQIGQALSFTVTATDQDVGQSLTFTATGLPTGATFSQTNATSGQFNWTPGAAQSGSYTVSFKATDNGSPAMSDTKTVSVTVELQLTQTTGPEGGSVRAFLVNGSNIYAGTGYGVYLSTNNGLTWKGVNNGLPTDFNGDTFAVNGGDIFVGGNGWGVYRSADGGQSWTDASAGLTDSLEIKLKAHNGNLFAGTFQGGVYISTNNGQTWTQANNGLPPYSAGFISVSALEANGGNLFASTNGGVYLSTNNGQSWTPVNNGLPANSSVDAFAVSGVNLFASVYGIQGSGVYLSTNNGQSWTPVSNGLPANSSVDAFAVSGVNLFASVYGIEGSVHGVYLSTNNGQSWTPVNNGLTNLEVDALAVNSGNLFAGTYGDGVYRSINNGQNWTQINHGLANTYVFAMAASGAAIFAGTQGQGVHLSTDNGQNWTPINNGLPPNSNVEALALIGGNIFAAVSDFDGFGVGVYLSTNNGQNWTPVNNGLTNLDVQALLVSGDNLFAGTGAGVYLSTNNGQSWTPVNNGLPLNSYVLAFAVNGVNLFACVTGNQGGGAGVYLSTNNGQSWTPVNNGLTDTYVNALAVSGGNLFVGTNSGVFLSTNNGQNWTPVNNGLPGLAVSALAASGGFIFAGTYLDGVYFSTNNGQNWTRINDGDTDLEVESLVVSGDKLFVGTWGYGVWVARF